MVRKKGRFDPVGGHIRAKVLPHGMSVTEAARRLGVGRPALSNLLNGNAALSWDMALRLEKTFGADRQALLDLQARHEQEQRRDVDRVVPVSAYVPDFLVIKARQIELWADSVVEARTDLPVLLRKLIYTTGRELAQVDLPGYDNVQRKGWDGWVEAGAATPWIPAGLSGWEFGTDERPERKANDDHAARLKAVPPEERAQTALVFVTPRNWPGKRQWAENREREGRWKAVRAFDASDLEQWLETSVSARIWLAEKLGIPTEGFETLEQCWHRWSSASEPPMSPVIFEPSLAPCRDALRQWLAQPAERPFVVAGDSKDETLAFLSQIFADSEIAAQPRDLPVVFDSAQTLRKLLSSSSPFIPIVTSDEVERELATAFRRLHCIVVRPRNAANSEPDIALDLLSSEAFEKALTAMQIEGDRAQQLGRASGYSPTILRRRLSPIEAIRRPAWAKDADTARTLIPMALIGAWHVRSSADCEILSRLARRANPEIEEALARLLTFDDSPVWSVAQHRGVASKMDALFAVSPYITETHLSDFFDLALYVLSESDPALELPEGERWMAGVYGKVRNHSGALRQGVCETLVILAVHGNNLFRDRLGFDFEARVSALIERLLTPLTLDKLLSNDHDLPRYAEAAPDTVLSILEHDLRNPAPVLLGLLKPADSGPFGRCLRTGLLWALEVLAWNPRTLSRVTAILAQLSRTGIDDNWANKPIASLHAIYRCWMPQTAATLPARLQALEALVRKFPDIGWEICIDQFSPHSRMGSYSYRPHWRNDASSAGHVLTRGETDQFARKALDLAVAWPNHDARTLGDLIERLDGMTEQDQEMVWNLASAWAESATDEEAKAVLRERIRRFAFTRRGRGRRLKSATRDRAREIRAKLTPSDPVVRHGWLFAKHWVEESAEEIEDSALDYSKRSERIHEQRRAAMTEIWRDRGLDGAMTLLRASEAPVVIGYYAGLSVTDPAELTNVIVTLLTAPAENDGRSDGFLQGLLQSVDATIRPVLLRRIANSVSPETAARLFRCAPFSEETWRLLDEQTPEVRERYWRDVMPQWNRFSDTELNEVIDKFLEVQRPRVAFHAVHMDWDRIETSRLKRLMTLLPRGNEPEGTFRLDSYEIAEALKELDQRPGVTRDEMAQLEFLYIRALDHSEYGIPNLERQVAESPAVFVQAVALAYKRSDDGQDPPGWSVEDPEQRSAIGLSAHHLLRRIRLIPGTESGVINANVLRDWLIETRRLCAEHARADIGDQHIGQLLAQAPPEPDGSQWPCRAVCEAMEAVASEHIGRGFHVGVYNSRGVVWRGEGGAQERELARKYRTFAQQTAIDFPFVSSVLESIASSYDRDAEREDSEARVSRRLSR